MSFRSAHAQTTSTVGCIVPGDIAGVSRDYGDSRPNPTGHAQSIADPFADGALDRVPDTIPAAPNGVTLSVYATYALPAPPP